MFVLENRLRQEAPRNSPNSSVRVPAIPRHQRKYAPFILSKLHTLFPAPKLQPAHFHALPHSLPHRRNLTLAFPRTCTLLPRSRTKQRKLTPLLSCACARFCRYGGYAANSRTTLTLRDEVDLVLRRSFGRMQVLQRVNFKRVLRNSANPARSRFSGRKRGNAR